MSTTSLKDNSIPSSKGCQPILQECKRTLQEVWQKERQETRVEFERCLALCESCESQPNEELLARVMIYFDLHLRPITRTGIKRYLEDNNLYELQPYVETIHARLNYCLVRVDE